MAQSKYEASEEDENERWWKDFSQRHQQFLIEKLMQALAQRRVGSERAREARDDE